jgi:HSP20 family protein
MMHPLIPRSWLADFGLDPRASEDWLPRVESFSTKDGEVVVRFDLPGVDAKDVEVSLEDDTLTVRGERKDEHDGQTYREVRYGRFERTLTVPQGIDPEKVRATHSNGVLEIRLPAPASRKVAIQIHQAEPKKAA